MFRVIPDHPQTPILKPKVLTANMMASKFLSVHRVVPRPFPAWCNSAQQTSHMGPHWKLPRSPLVLEYCEFIMHAVPLLSQPASSDDLRPLCLRGNSLEDSGRGHTRHVPASGMTVPTCAHQLLPAPCPGSIAGWASLLT
ncbi:hypothetical protein GJAV_G00202350 [Gymnothorax javanicus]|nr:hypothetical protein GJAV_G00202350 [Gymnothorax javanicus]